MADKKGLPSIINKWGTDISRRDFGKGLTTLATEIATGSLTDKGISTVTKAVKGSSIADKLPMTRNLLKELYKLEYKLDKVIHSLRKNKEDLILDNQGEGGQYLRQFVNDLQYDIRNRETIKRSLKNAHELYTKEYVKNGTTDLNEKLEKINASIEDKFYIMEGMSKTQKKAVKEILNLKSQMNTVRVIAKDKKVPLNFYKDKISEIEETYLDDVAGGEIMGEPWHQVLEEDRKDMLDDVFNNPNNLAELESIQEEYLLMDTPEYFESLKNDIQNNRIDVDDFKDSSVFMDLQDVISNPNASLQQKEEAYKLAAQNIIALRKRMSEVDIFSNEIYNDMRSFSDSEFDDPDKKQIILKAVQDEFKNAATKAGLKIGQKITETLYDKYKGTKLKTSTVPQIQSDKTRAEKAKEVKEVKPKRNLVEDLKGVGRIIKTSPYVAGALTALTPTKIDPEYTAELPLETSPRGYGRRRENKGRVSQDPYKTYNTQRFI